MKNILFRKASVFNLSVFGVLFVPALLAGFLLAQPALASAYSKIISQSSGPACYYNFNGYGEAKSGQSFTATSTNLVSLGLMIAPYSTISEIKICEGDFSTSQPWVSTNSDWNCDNSGQKPVLSFKPDSSNTFYNSATGWTDFDFPFPIVSKIGQKYFALFRISGTNICLQYWNDNYLNGQARVGGFDITDFTFNIYSTPDPINWSAATPDKVGDLKVDDYYSSGNSAKLNWTTPNTYQLFGTSTYEIEYWPKLYNCQTDYGFGGIPGAKKQVGEYTAGPGQKSEAVVKDLNKNSSYCLAITSSNQFNKSELSNFIEANTNDSDLTEDVDQKNDVDYPNTINVNVPMILAQTFIPQKENISSLELLVKSQNSAIGYIGEVRLCKGQPTSSPRAGFSNDDWSCQGPNQELVATTTIDKSLLANESLPLTWLRIPFSSTKKLIPGDDYFFSFYGYKIIVGSIFNNEGAYPDGWATGANVADLNFRTFYDTGLKGQKRNPVILIPGFFGSGESRGQLELDPILHTYNNLWEALKLAGYEKDKTLFAFPYNWRQSNITSSLLLKQKIDEVKTACVSANLDGYDCNKVDLVAHSMGGLVARVYAESNDYEDDIDQLIFLATPQRGSPMAYLSWEGGEAGLGFEKTIMEKILLSEADGHGYLSNFSYIRNLPMTSVQELLPIFNYLRDKGSDSLRTYPYDNYPRNLFLENLNDSYNLAKLQNIKILNIVADAGINKTMNAFRVVSGGYSDGRWEHGYPEDYGRLFADRGLEYGEGDDTVPAISNRGFNGFDEVLVNNSNHSNIVSDAQGFVIEELTGNRPSQEVSKNFIQKIFMARIFSPADFLITAPDGKRIGKDFTTGQDINEIDGAYYSGKFATIPNPLDGEYKVELQGTGNGEYKLSISGIDDATSTDKDFIGQITTGAIQDFKIDYSSSSPNLLEDLQPQDTISPSLTINSPLDSVEYKHNEKMVINYDASDDFSGISSVVIKIDDKEISSTTVNLFDYQIGMHSLSVVVIDNAGNFAEKRVDFKIVADIKSTIGDIEEVYDRDWLKGLSRKNILIGELKILESALNLIDRAKVETIKKIDDAKNNPKLSARAKERLITSLNSILVGLDESRQKVVSLNLGIFEKTLNEFKKSNYLNQGGYDVLKSDSEYLKINL